MINKLSKNQKDNETCTLNNNSTPSDNYMQVVGNIPSNSSVTYSRGQAGATTVTNITTAAGPVPISYPANGGAIPITNPLPATPINGNNGTNNLPGIAIGYNTTVGGGGNSGFTAGGGNNGLTGGNTTGGIYGTNGQGSGGWWNGVYYPYTTYPNNGIYYPYTTTTYIPPDSKYTVMELPRQDMPTKIYVCGKLVTLGILGTDVECAYIGGQIVFSPNVISINWLGRTTIIVEYKDEIYNYNINKEGMYVGTSHILNTTLVSTIKK